MRCLPVFLLLAVGIVMTATTGIAEQTPPGFGFHYLDAERAAGQKLFNDRCATCHASRRQALGPSLNGVVGRPAGSVAGFPYSDALKKSGLIWTEDNLRKWIADTAGTIPHTLMPHVSLSDPAERIYIIEYLKTLKGRTAR